MSARHRKYTIAVNQLQMLCCSLVVLISSSGCHLWRRNEAQLSGPKGAYDAVRLTYQLPAGQLAPRTETSGTDKGGVQLASHKSPTVDTADRTGGETRVRTLSLQYPHPNGLSGFALAELVIEKPQAAISGSSSGTGGSDSTTPPGWFDRYYSVLRDNLPGVAYADGVAAAYALDVPIADIDRIVQLLDSQGYFAPEVTQAAYMQPFGTSVGDAPLLAARINTVDVQRAWRVTPELNDLVWRVRNEGRLVAHRRPVERLRVASSGMIPAQSQPLILRLPPVGN